MTAFKAVIVPVPGDPSGEIDNELPGSGFGGRPDNSLPWAPGRPSTGPILPPHGPWPGFPVNPWVPAFPTPPIVIPPGPEIGNDLPIVLPPGHAGHPLPVVPARPTLPIVLPNVPEMALALVIPLPNAEPKDKPDGVPDGSVPAILYFGPGTLPSVCWVSPPATPK